MLALPDTVSRLAQLPASERSPAQAAKLRWCFLDHYAPEAMRAARKEALDLRRAARAADRQFSDRDGDAG